ncbi:tRNA guanosine(34) transglycosylase Tgt [Alkalispirochaeta alkalica]|uniref:tRNA guanosine(34) transglycosylase Tgt n=1 Tax=Alkalispirochaeta alkalica TaxID=46356 RepID=UPI00036EEAE9|nr:tRNA guanosine(34) transglycosylase Tgt [Alkalispirochaeta alkalica]
MAFFSIDKTDKDCAARTGTLVLPHGPVSTPAFMPVGTAGTVKAVDHDQLHQMGYRLILANTYHLFLRPGMETIGSFGGLHNFSSWNHNILTDSGGYQIFSLAPFRKITDEGASFRSHLDGSKHLLTPERTVDIQVTIGSDIQMVLDVCTGPDIDHRAALEALDTTTRWAARARRRWTEQQQEQGYAGALFGIVQGNFFPDLRTEAVQRTEELDFPGIALGGLSVGEPFSTYCDILAHTAPLLPREKPRYVMGIGTPEYILAAIEQGIDMFDCVFPTRAARTGTLFTTEGRINFKSARYARSMDPPDRLIDSFGGRQYSLGYLRHLTKSNEILGCMLAAQHNLRFMKWLVDQSARAIREGTFRSFKKDFLERYAEGTRAAREGSSL